MKHIIGFLDKLIGESYGLRNLGNAPDSSDQFDRQFTRWVLSSKQVLEHASLQPFLSEVRSVLGDESYHAWQVSRIAGVLESARECMEGGFVGQLRHLLHAEMFESFSEQAKELLETGHRIPAAVLARIVIEKWLRDQGEKAKITDWQTLRASAINDNLKNVAVFSAPKWRHIQSLLDIGNSAAHGKDTEFTDADVKRMIDFIEVECT